MEPKSKWRQHRRSIWGRVHAERNHSDHAIVQADERVHVKLSDVIQLATSSRAAADSGGESPARSTVGVDLSLPVHGVVLVTMRIRTRLGFERGFDVADHEAQAD